MILSKKILKKNINLKKNILNNILLHKSYKDNKLLIVKKNSKVKFLYNKNYLSNIFVLNKFVYILSFKFRTTNINFNNFNLREGFSFLFYKLFKFYNIMQKRIRKNIFRFFIKYIKILFFNKLFNKNFVGFNYDVNKNYFIDDNDSQILKNNFKNNLNMNSVLMSNENFGLYENSVKDFFFKFNYKKKNIRIL